MRFIRSNVLEQVICMTKPSASAAAAAAAAHKVCMVASDVNAKDGEKGGDK
jgi:hypothetical protein